MFSQDRILPGRRSTGDQQKKNRIDFPLNRAGLYDTAIEIYRRKREKGKREKKLNLIDRDIFCSRMMMLFERRRVRAFTIRMSMNNDFTIRQFMGMQKHDVI